LILAGSVLSPLRFHRAAYYWSRPILLILAPILRHSLSLGSGIARPRFLKTFDSLDQTSTLRFSRLFEGY
ncbi:hypothetical protein LINPERHAP1_LOCUS4599, partial [Linum perenne]